jgi:hypothetical protein
MLQERREMNESPSAIRVRLVLRAGSIVFGLSALALIFAPALFNSLLGLALSAWKHG